MSRLSSVFSIIFFINILILQILFLKLSLLYLPLTAQAIWTAWRSSYVKRECFGCYVVTQTAVPVRGDRELSTWNVTEGQRHV